MPFVDETGNSGLSKAVQGMARGFETARRIQDSQQAREMAMKELELRQDRTDLAFDQFTEQVRRSKEQGARADLQLAEGIAHRKASRGLAQQKFDLIAGQETRAQEMRAARGEANSLLLKAMGDDSSMSKEDYDTLVGSVRALPSEMQTEVLLKAKGLMAQQEAESQKAWARNIASSKQFIIGSAGTDQERETLAEELLEAEIVYADDPRGYREAVHGIQMRILQASGKRKEIERWGGESSAQIESSIFDPTEKQEAYMLRQQVLEIGAADPTDPRIDEYRERIDWLRTPLMVRGQREAERKELYSAQLALKTLGMGSSDEMQRLEQLGRAQAGILTQGFGEGFAKSEEQRGVEMVAGLKAAGLDINLDVLLPADTALPQQLEYAFQQVEAASLAMAGAVPPEAIEAHANAMFEKAGIVADDATRTMYGEWTMNKGTLDTSKLDKAAIIRANNYKAEEREGPAGYTEAEKVAREESIEWLETFRENQKARKGASKIPQAWPPVGIEDQARSMGWKPKMVKEMPTMKGLRTVEPDGTLSTYMRRIAKKQQNKVLTDQGWVQLDKDGKPKPFWREQTRDEAEAERTGGN